MAGCNCSECRRIRSPEALQAERRARSLLMEMLTERQREELKHCGSITVPPKLPGEWTYRIEVGKTSLAVHRRCGKRVERFCVDVETYELLPISDRVLTLYAWIVGYTSMFLVKANVIQRFGDA